MAIINLYSLASCILIILYGLKSKLNALNSISLSIILCAIPSLFLGYVGPDAARIGGIPIGYIFTLSSLSTIILHTKFKYSNYYKSIILVFSALILYLIFQSIIVSTHIVSSLQYIIMWAFYGLSMMSISQVLSTISDRGFKRFFLYLSNTFIFCLSIGFFKLISVGSVADRASFFVLINKNAAVFYIVIMAGIVTFMWRHKLIPNWIYFIQIFLTFLNIITLRSRTGILGIILLFIFIFIYNYKKKSVYYLLLLAFIFLMGSLHFTMDNISVFDRFNLNYGRYLTTLISGNEAGSSGLKEERRINILLTNIKMLKDIYLTGTGVGIKNYVSKIFKYTDRDSGYSTKAHNFYISYFNEFGILGYTLLLIFFYLTYRKFSIYPGYKIEEEIIFYKITFICLSIMLIFNEYITYPFLWVFLGIGLGYSHRRIKDVRKYLFYINKDDLKFGNA